MLPDGETGELVITSLTKEACPVIRYRTRDLTRLAPGTANVAVLAVIAALLLWRHRANIRRLAAGTESRIGRRTTK